MPRSPSIVPHADPGDVYLVLEDFGGGLGRAWSETSEHDTGRATLMRQIMEGQYKHPARIVVFNTAEGWSRDITVEIADALRRCFVEFNDVAPAALEFIERVRRS